MSYTLEAIGNAIPTIPPMPESGAQPKEKDTGTQLAVKIAVDDTDLDVAIEKANRLVELLSEASSIVHLLGEQASALPPGVTEDNDGHVRI